MIQLADRLELFVDHYLVDQLAGTSLRLHHPQPAETVLTFDKPWEGAFVGYCTILKDGDLYRLYYRGWPNALEKGVACYCYAESTDGVHFTRPSLGLIEHMGTRDNNVILINQGSHSLTPFIDTRPGVPADQRFKATVNGRTAENKPCLKAYASADGIRWAPMSDEPIITEGAFDSQNVSFWSEAEGCYVCYFRSWSEATKETPHKGIRAISRATSPDFLHWTQPVLMTYGDVEPDQLYTNQTHPYFRAPHIYLAFPKRFVPNRETLSEQEAQAYGVIDKYRLEVSEGVFMSTRAGSTQYDRPFMEGFLRPGRERANWVSRTNLSTQNVVPTGPDEISIYYQHRYAQAAAYLKRYTLRTDGFVSVNAPWRGGTMTTKPFTFTGDHLVINFATGAAGHIRVELQNEAGNPIAGYTLDDCPMIHGDLIERTVAWTGGEDLKSIAGRAVRLHLEMKDADLYSIRFAGSPSK